MEDRDYKVLRVSEKPPREWQGPAGTVYYINCMLEGHEKPVSIGKKTPDALKPGDTVYGHILVEQSFPEDKWKAGQKQGNFGGGGFSKPQSNPYTGSSKPAYKDNSDGQRQGMCFNNAANYISTIHKGEPLAADSWAFEVHRYANTLYKLGDLGGSEDTNPKAPVNNLATRSTPPMTSKPLHKVDTRDPDAKLWPSDFSDDDLDPEFASMIQAGLQADGIDPDELPVEFR